MRDQELTEWASRGDAETFARLVPKYSDLVYRVASRIRGGKDAQDVSQEIRRRVWLNKGKFGGDSAFSTWLYRISVNTCLGERREERQNQAIREFEYKLSYLPPSFEDVPETATLLKERREELLRALGRVRIEHRAALVLRHMEGLSYAEVAEVLEVPEGTARGWVGKGRASLLVALSQRGNSR